MAEYNIDLGYKPRDWQKRVHLSRKQRNVVVLHRRAGKTVMAVVELIDSALRCTKANGRFAYIAPFRSQAKDLAWTYLKDYATKVPHTKVSETELWVEFANGARIRCYGSDNAPALRGVYFDGVILDEMADVDDDFVGQVLMPTLADRDGWLIMMGTPKGTDGLSLAFNKHRDDPDWFCIKMNCLETNALSEKQLATLKSGMTDAEWQQEMMCDFEAGVVNVLISGFEVEEAMCRKYMEKEYYGSAIVIGVDVARQGNDRTVITRRQGHQAFPPIILRGEDNVSVARHLMREIDTYKPDAVFVDGTGGFGGGVIDTCKQYGYSIQEVHFGGTPLDKRFANCRAEMWFSMCHWIRTGGALAQIPEYRTEITAPRYKHDDAGRLILESKDDIKGRSIPSPDLADSLALTFYSNVVPGRDRYGNLDITINRRSSDDSKDAFYL